MLINTILSFIEKVVKNRLNTELKRGDCKLVNFNLESIQKSKIKNILLSFDFIDSELVTLFIALIPHIAPNFFNNIISEYLPNGGEFPEFGGVKGKNHRGILPTGETILYILAGTDIEKRIEVSKLFDEDHLFARENILYIEPVPQGEPKMSGRLVLEDDYVDLFVQGKLSVPKLSADFPAQLITTELEWSNLVLQKSTINEIYEIETWLKYNDKLLVDWQMKGKIKPGYRILFHGPPGTGKTMTACLLGKYTGRDVFRIDLSMVVSKYIGETEKNLSKLFNKAANKEWILFFDEADSIFGKRTNVRDAHDKYANQEVSYLLQRIESHAGLVILASNMKSNIDSSFTRRFNSIIEFENPGVDERERLWQNYIPENIKVEKDISIKDIARKYEITGANIVNVIQSAGLQTLKRNSDTIAYNDLIKGIQKEYFKEGKMIRKE
jgi:AAA+ superfamily predicted ATPase